MERNATGERTLDTDFHDLNLVLKKMKSKREVVLKAVQKDGFYLNCASEELKNDKEVVLAAVQQDGWSLQYASEELKNDKEVVLKAVQRRGISLRYASEALKNDKEIVLKALQKSGILIYFASEELKNDKEVVLVALNTMECKHLFKIYCIQTKPDMFLDDLLEYASVKKLENQNVLKKIYQYVKDNFMCNYGLVNKAGRLYSYSKTTKNYPINFKIHQLCDVTFNLY